MWALYGVAAYGAVAQLGPGGFALVILPVTLTAWYGGLRWGLVGGLFGVLFNAVVSALVHKVALDPLVSFHEGGWPGVIVMFLVGVVVGHLRDLRARLRESEALLQTLNARLEERVEARTAELEQVNARLQHSAFHDALTGLPNRALFNNALAHALERAKRSLRYPSVLFLDFDRFKVINDSLGHEAGDALLVAVAGRLRETLRAADVVARLGGDEFVIFLEDVGKDWVETLTNEAGKAVSPAAGAATDKRAALEAAERIVRALEQPFEVAGHDLHVSTSIGLVASTAGYEGPDEVLRDADIAMYRAKALGRGRVAVFDERMREDAFSRMTLEAELRGAAQRGELEVFYQPILTAGGALTGFEALVRWRHPDRGLVSPGAFVPVAEETGLIVALDRWVLRRAAAQIARWQRALPGGEALTLNVNLSSQGLARADLVDYVADVLRDTGLAAPLLRLELTESVIVSASGPVTAALEGLKALGVGLHIDDFGTGYSSLSYLQRLPLDTLKIDRSFVSRLLEPKGEALVLTILLMAQTLGLNVVAEGVESPAQLERLRELGCPFVQGFLFAPPLPAPDVPGFVSRARREAQGPTDGARQGASEADLGVGLATDGAVRR